MAIVTAIPPRIISRPERILFQGGKVYNAKKNTFERKDLEITNGKISAIGKDLPIKDRTFVKRLQADSHISPGWIDLHTHFYGCWGQGMDPIKYGFLKGATLQVDAGSAGMSTMEDFVEGIIKKANGYLIAMMNISPAGLAQQTGENLFLTNHNAERTAEKAIEFDNKMMKIRMGDTQTGTDPVSKECLEMTKKAAKLAGNIPTMVHIQPGVKLKQLTEMLDEGDIITHAFRRDGDCSLLDSNYKLKPFVKAFLKKGGRLDVGHGMGGFDKENAEVFIALFQELLANEHYKLYSSSTDGHCFSREELAKSLADVMAKMISLGATKEDVISSVTKVPAESLGLPASRWRMHVGDQANLTIWNHEVSANKIHTFKDPHDKIWQGNEMFKPTDVYVNGELIEISKV